MNRNLTEPVFYTKKEENMCNLFVRFRITDQTKRNITRK